VFNDWPQSREVKLVKSLANLPALTTSAGRERNGSFPLRSLAWQTHSLPLTFPFLSLLGLVITASRIPTMPAPLPLSFCIASLPSPSWPCSLNTLTRLRISVGKHMCFNNTCSRGGHGSALIIVSYFPNPIVFYPLLCVIFSFSFNIARLCARKHDFLHTLHRFSSIRILSRSSVTPRATQFPFNAAR
jgi:hypothetical protein